VKNVVMSVTVATAVLAVADNVNARTAIVKRRKNEQSIME
jgi:hypothetical protein